MTARPSLDPTAGALLTSTEVAKLLGVTAATVKRWADTGLLECARTAGRHRRFDAAVVDRFRREHGGAPAAAPSLVDLLLEEPEPLVVQAELLRSRARLGAWWRVAEAVGPELDELGQRWADGKVGILEEHLASERLSRALARCAETLPPRNGAPRVLLAAAEGEEHLLGLCLVDLCLREGGWRPLWSGRVTPASEILRLVESGGIDAVALSASVAAYGPSLAHEAAALGAACARQGIALVAGGRGPWTDPIPGGELVRTFDGLRGWMERMESRRPPAAP